MENTISHFCLKCKIKIENMPIEEVVKSETSDRYYAIGTCHSCELKQKRPIKKELALEILEKEKVVVEEELVVD